MSDRSKTDNSSLGREAADGAKDVLQDTIIGSKDWKTSKFGYLSGFTALKRSTSSFSGPVGDAKSRWGSLFRYTFRQDEAGVAISADIEDSRERFRAAMQANGRSLADVNRSVDNTYRQFWLFTVLLALGAAWGIGGLIGGGLSSGIMIIFEIMFRLALIPALAALALRAGYTNWMFRRRRLDAITDYLKSGDIWPKKAPRAPVPVPTTKPGSKAALFAIALAGAMLAVLMPDLAYAQMSPSQIFETQKTPDLFMRLMSYVIPDAGPVSTPDIGVQAFHTAIKNGFMAFSGTLLFIGSAMTGWHILKGLVASAKEGKALGSNYHEVWAPMRVVLGFGMLVPAVKGLCAAQILVLYLIAWGGNIANFVWAPYIDTVTVGTLPGAQAAAQDTVKMGNQANATAAVKAVFEKTLCAEVVNIGNQRLGIQNAQISLPPAWKDPSYWQIQKSQDMDFGPVCGKISLNLTTDRDTPERQNEQRMLDAKKEAITQIVNNEGLRNFANQAAQTYFTTQGSGQGAARMFSDQGTANEKMELFKQAREGYITAVTNSVMQALNSSDPNNSNEIRQLREQAKKDGWAASGVYFLTLARVQARVYAAASEGLQIGQVSPTRTNGQSAFIADALSGTKENPGAMIQFDAWWDGNMREITTSNSSMSQASQAVSETSSNPVSYVLNQVFGGLANAYNKRSDSTQLVINPMGDMISYGNGLLVSSQVALVSGAAMAGAIEGGEKQAIGKVANFFSGAISMVKGAFGFLTPFLTMVILAILAAGALHAFVIPMIPYIMTVFFVAGMLTLVVEGLAAAPLWAFFHIRMDGQEFVDNVQKPGYMVAFNLILRPVLMIFGVVLSYIVFGAMLWFVNYTFIPASNALSQSSSIGIIGMLIMIVLMSYLDFQIAIRSFQLITDIPERVSRWFGQGGDRLGDDHDAKQTTGIFVGGIERRASSLAQGTGNASAMRARGKQPISGDGQQPPAALPPDPGKKA
ncbi:DotA/TraY family protein [Bosea sp. RAC05]|uniref:DotA/TraY family protein n=1 Tax=Bosea sp. RAC05 TaxID=1842539 RepID=UPI00083CE111|nr:DotA/TraY family protein [Bosea sp. RAC05]AOG02942.1 conjugal transfer/type IV secretion DotA/TraY family protein [Bosea sp. RAC05]